MSEKEWPTALADKVNKPESQFPPLVEKPPGTAPSAPVPSVWFVFLFPLSLSFSSLPFPLSAPFPLSLSSLLFPFPLSSPPFLSPLPLSSLLFPFPVPSAPLTLPLPLPSTLSPSLHIYIPSVSTYQLITNRGKNVEGKKEEKKAAPIPVAEPATSVPAPIPVPGSSNNMSSTPAPAPVPASASVPPPSASNTPAGASPTAANPPPSLISSTNNTPPSTATPAPTPAPSSSSSSSTSSSSKSKSKKNKNKGSKNQKNKNTANKSLQLPPPSNNQPKPQANQPSQPSQTSQSSKKGQKAEQEATSNTGKDKSSTTVSNNTPNNSSQQEKAAKATEIKEESKKNAEKTGENSKTPSPDLKKAQIFQTASPDDNDEFPLPPDSLLAPPGLSFSSSSLLQFGKEDNFLENHLHPRNSGLFNPADDLEDEEVDESDLLEQVAELIIKEENVDDLDDLYDEPPGLSLRTSASSLPFSDHTASTPISFLNTSWNSASLLSQAPSLLPTSSNDPFDAPPDLHFPQPTTILSSFLRDEHLLPSNPSPWGREWNSPAQTPPFAFAEDNEATSDNECVFPDVINDLLDHTPSSHASNLPSALSMAAPVSALRPTGEGEKIFAWEESLHSLQSSTANLEDKTAVEAGNHEAGQSPLGSLSLNSLPGSLLSELHENGAGPNSSNQPINYQDDLMRQFRAMLPNVNVSFSQNTRFNATNGAPGSPGAPLNPNPQPSPNIWNQNANAAPPSPQNQATSNPNAMYNINQRFTQNQQPPQGPYPSPSPSPWNSYNPAFSPRNPAPPAQWTQQPQQFPILTSLFNQFQNPQFSPYQNYPNNFGQRGNPLQPEENRFSNGIHHGEGVPPFLREENILSENSNNQANPSAAQNNIWSQPHSPFPPSKSASMNMNPQAIHPSLRPPIPFPQQHPMPPPRSMQQVMFNEPPGGIPFHHPSMNPNEDNLNGFYFFIYFIFSIVFGIY